VAVVAEAVEYDRSRTGIFRRSENQIVTTSFNKLRMRVTGSRFGSQHSWTYDTAPSLNWLGLTTNWHNSSHLLIWIQLNFQPNKKPNVLTTWCTHLPKSRNAQIPGDRSPVATKLCTVRHNTRGLSVWNLLRVTHNFEVTPMFCATLSKSFLGNFVYPTDLYCRNDQLTYLLHGAESFLRS